MNSDPHESFRPDPSARSPLDWPAESGLGAELAREIRAEASRRALRRRRLGFAVAGCVALVGFFLRPAPSVPSAAPVAFRVSAPERRVLPDGSVVELRNGAAIELDFSPARRRIVLARGEAHFAVTRNPDRPFVVAVDGVEVRAVGTAFSVGRGGALVDVVVTEGRVAVEREAAPPTAIATLLSAGNRATVNVDAAAAPAPEVTALSVAELDRHLSWRVPRLEFSDAPLAEVVRLFAAHGPLRFQLADVSLHDVRVSGVLRADNGAALIELLAADHGIEAVASDGVIVLRRR